MALHGFLAPVDNPPAVNRVTAGQVVLLRFRLGAFQGEDPAAAPPTVQRNDCASGAPIGAAAPATFALGLDPAFVPVLGYTYGWRTDRGWRGTCGTFTVTLADGTTHEARFRFA